MMEWHILPGYVREDEIRQLFEEYTALLLAGDPEFAGYLALQHYEDELSHPAASMPRRPAVPGLLRGQGGGLHRAEGAGGQMLRNEAAVRAAGVPRTGDCPGAGAPPDAGGEDSGLPADAAGYFPLSGGGRRPV